MILPTSVYIVKGHWYCYSCKILKAFCTEEEAKDFSATIYADGLYDRRRRRGYDYLTWRSYEVEPCVLSKHPKFVYATIFQQYLSDPDIRKVFYSKEAARAADDKEIFAGFRWEEIELELKG